MARASPTPPRRSAGRTPSSCREDGGRRARCRCRTWACRPRRSCCAGCMTSTGVSLLLAITLTMRSPQASSAAVDATAANDARVRKLVSDWEPELYAELHTPMCVIAHEHIQAYVHICMCIPSRGTSVVCQSRSALKLCLYVLINTAMYARCCRSLALVDISHHAVHNGCPACATYACAAPTRSSAAYPAYFK